MIGPTEKLAQATTTSVELGWVLSGAFTLREQPAWCVLLARQEPSTQQEPPIENFGEELSKEGWAGHPSLDLHLPSARDRLVSSSLALPLVHPSPSSSGSSPRVSTLYSPWVEVHHPGEEDWRRRP